MMRTTTIVFAGLAALATFAASDDAAAQAGNKALAEQLFNQGRDLAKNKDWAAACPKFEASLRYDPALGTRLNLANCYENAGKLASAWGLYRESAELADKAGDVKRRDYARKQAQSLEPRLPKLTILGPQKTPDGLTITRDGLPVDKTVLGTPLYVDPGEYEVVATAPAQTTFKFTVRVEEAKAATVQIAELAADPKAPKKVSSVAGEGDADAAVFADSSPPSPVRRYVGLGAVGAGAVAIGVGAFFGLSARSTNNDARELCGDDLQCASDEDFTRGQKLIDDARSKGTLSTVFIAGGVALAAGGVYLWLTAPDRGAGDDERNARLAPSVGDGTVGLVYSAGF